MCTTQNVFLENDAIEELFQYAKLQKNHAGLIIVKSIMLFPMPACARS